MSAIGCMRRTAAGPKVMHAAEVSLEGHTETVARYDYGQCDPRNEANFAYVRGRDLVVLGADHRRIDEKKTAWLAAGSRPDLFLHRGQVFINSWAGNVGFKEGSLRVSTPLAMVGQRSIVCDYRYQGNWPGRQP